MKQKLDVAYLKKLHNTLCDLVVHLSKLDKIILDLLENNGDD